MNRPLPEEERLARQRARKLAWWNANPNYRAEYQAKNLEQIRERNRDRMRAAAAEQKRREREAERVREWSRQNPDKRKAARERYKQKNPEKYRAAQREYYHRNKAAIQARRLAREGRDPDKLRETRRARGASRRSKDPARKWTPSEEQREKYQARDRERKHLKRRLAQAGLPPPKLHRRSVSERHVNGVAADAFFSRTRSRAEFRRISDGDLAENLLHGWAKYSTLVRRRNAFLGAVHKHLAKHGDELRDDVNLDSRARELRGRPPLEIDVEVRRRAVDAVSAAQSGMAPLKLTQSAARSRPPTHLRIEPDQSRGRER